MSVAARARSSSRARGFGRALTVTLLWSGLLLLIAYPLVMVLLSIVFAEQLGATRVALTEVVSARTAQAWRNTLQLGWWVTLGSVLLALPLALLAAQTRARLLDFVMVVPFLTPPFLVGLAWTLTVGPRGYLSRFGLPGEPLGRLLYSEAGLILLMAVNYAPIVYFALRAQLARVSGSLLWAALVAGESPLGVLWRVLLPLLLPGMLAGGFLTFASAIGEYGTPLVIGNRIGYPVIATEIARHVNVFPINLSMASLLGALLLALGAGAYGLSLLAGRKRILGAPRSHYPHPQLLSRSLLAPLWLLAGFYALVAVLIPLAAVALASLMRLVSVGPALDNLGWQNYAALLLNSPQGLRALLTSLVLALAAAACGMFLGVVAARGGQAVAFLATIPIAVPAITLAVGFIRGWNAPWAQAVPLYGTPLLVGLYYLAQHLPYSVQYVRAGQAALPTSLEQAAYVHGAGPLESFARVVLPLLWPHALAGAMLIFAVSFRELVGSVLLRPPGTHTSATYILSQFEQGSVSLGMAMGMMVVLASALSVLTAKHLGVVANPASDPTT